MLAYYANFAQENSLGPTSGDQVTADSAPISEVQSHPPIMKATGRLI